MSGQARLSNEELAAEAGAFDAEGYAAAHHIEIAHFRDLYSAAPDELKDRLGLSVEEYGSSLLFSASRLPHLLFARGHVGASGVLDLEELDALLASLEDKGVRDFLIQVDPRVPAVDARRHLEARGLEAYRRPWVKLLRGAEPPPSIACELEITEAAQEQGSLCADMMMNVFGLPAHGAPLYAATVGRKGWHWYLASENGEPAACGVSFQMGEDAYLAGGVTLPRFRRRHAQGALMQRRIEDALARGAKRIASETGFPFPDEENPSYRNMLFFGLRPVGTRQNFGRPGAKW